MDRYLTRPIRELLQSKIVLLVGARNTGKTTLARTISESAAIYDCGSSTDLKKAEALDWDPSKELIAFTSVNKIKNFGKWLERLVIKALPGKQKFLLTSSVEIPLGKRTTDLIQGKVHRVHIAPTDLRELKNFGYFENDQDNYRRLIKMGGFPEAYFEGTQKHYLQWNPIYLSAILTEEFPTLGRKANKGFLETLVIFLTQSVGFPITPSGIAKALDKPVKFVTEHLEILEQLLVCFSVSAKGGACADKKESSKKNQNKSRGQSQEGLEDPQKKYYFYDVARVNGTETQKLENLIALSIKKQLDYNFDILNKKGKVKFLYQPKIESVASFCVCQEAKKDRLICFNLNDGRLPEIAQWLSDYPTDGEKEIWIKSDLGGGVPKGHFQVKNVLTALVEFDLS